MNNNIYNPALFGERKEWAERIGFTLPDTSERFVITHIDGKMFVAETTNAQCLYQVLQFTSPQQRLAFLDKHNTVLRQVNDDTYMAFSCCARHLNTSERTAECALYLQTTFDLAAEWLRKEGVC